MPELIVLAEPPANMQQSVPEPSRTAKLVTALVRWSDSALRMPGTNFRFGLDPIIGLLLPGLGDALGGVVALSVVLLALQDRVPGRVVAKMVRNLAADATLGFVPGIGDVFDFAYRANQRNLELWRVHRRGRSAPASALLPWLRACLTSSLLLLAAMFWVVVPVVLSMGSLYALFNVGS
jgi:hypothetical protein